MHDISRARTEPRIADTQPRAPAPLVRVGVPLVSGELTRRCLDTGLPLLFSANAFARNAADGEFAGFRLQAAQRLPAQHDIALDSAGFVAACLYGDYRWSIDAYLDLVAARPWTWWSSLDYATEPEVAGNAAMRRLRIDATCTNFVRCANRAGQRGLQDPLYVIQGYTIADYEYAIQTAPFREWPALVGVGSVCRRHVHGEHGLLQVLQLLDSALPAGTKVHLYGCKGVGLAALRPYWSRIASVDSLAWDAGLRWAHPTGRTQAMRAQAMADWHARLQAMLADPAQRCLDLRVIDPLAAASEAIGSAIAELYGSNDLDYRDCNALVQQDVAVIRAVLQSAGPAAFDDPDPDDDFGLGICYGAVRQALIETGVIQAA
jgi:hypothetical protein